jgi:hypothetical protein
VAPTIRFNNGSHRAIASVLPGGQSQKQLSAISTTSWPIVISHHDNCLHPIHGAKPASLDANDERVAKADIKQLRCLIKSHTDN